MTIRRFVGVVTAVFLALPAAASAEPIRIFESGTPGPPGQTDGYSIGALGITGLRFFLPSSVTTETIGGHFAGQGDLFGAIVALSGPSDLPDSLDLSTPDVRGSARIVLSSGATVRSQVFSSSLRASLTSGWYALVFGSGLFGTTGEGVFVFGNSPRTAQVLVGSGGVARPDIPWLEGTLGSGRLYAFVDGRVAPPPAPIPEPSSLVLLAGGLIGLLKRWRC